MPPFINLKRRDSSPDPASPPKKKAKVAVSSPSAREVKDVTKKKKKKKPKPKIRTEVQRLEKKPTLFDSVDTKKPSGKVSLGKLFGEDDASDSDRSSTPSDAESEDFEDVVTRSHAADTSDAGDDESEPEDWEDAMVGEVEAVEESVPEDMQLNLGAAQARPETYGDLRASKKQGPSKKEKHRRILAHSMHVQFLMWHNHVRNHWLNDSQVQKTLIDHMKQSKQMRVQYESWKRKAGIRTEPGSAAMQTAAGAKSSKERRLEDKGDPRSERDWGRPAERQAVGEPDLSRGDPLQQFLSALSTWWKQRFTITSCGLRKRGYTSPMNLKLQIDAWREGSSDLKLHGERIADLKEFRDLASLCEGSRDVGAQLFVALLRGLGIETRLAASIQPLGFGWTKLEEAEPLSKAELMKAAQQNGAGPGAKPKRTGNASGPTKPNGSTIKKKPDARRTTTSGSSKADAIPLSDTSDLSDLSDINAHHDEDSDTSIIDITPKRRPNLPYDRDLPFPIYWAEAISTVTHRCFPVDPFVVRPSVATSPEHLMLYEARGAKAEKARQVFAYVVAHSSDNTAKDVTVRYVKKHVWPGKTKGFRLSSVRVPIYDHRGRVRAYYDLDWWQSVLRVYRRPDTQRTIADDIEDENELKPIQPEKKAPKEGIPDTLDGFKKSAEYVLARNLRREEAILPGAASVHTFKSGKGAKAIEEDVYLRKDVATCRTSESWHKEGRQIMTGEQPLKMVPIRAVTTTRKREIEESERATGEKPMQGMYSKEQTEWIVPEPIKDGVIPKNSYGNMDAFVPQMVPKGAVHIPLRGTVRICKKLEIDYAEAVTGFEFGNRMAVPVIEGVVVAIENEDLVIDAWEKADEERKAREAVKQEKLVLGKWRRFLMGLRIAERMRDEFEIDIPADTSQTAFDEPKIQARGMEKIANSEPDMRSLHEIVGERASVMDSGGGFLLEDEDDDGLGGGFLAEGYDHPNGTTKLRADGKYCPEDDPHDGGVQDFQSSKPIAGKMRSLVELAGRQAIDQNHELEVPAATKETRKGGSTVGSKTGRGVAGRRSAKVKASNIKRSAEAVSQQGESDTQGSDISQDFPPSAKAATATGTPGSRRSTRSAARRSKSKIRSQFFGTDSDDEEEDEDTQPASARKTKGLRKAKQA